MATDRKITNEEGEVWGKEQEKNTAREAFTTDDYEQVLRMLGTSIGPVARAALQIAANVMREGPIEDALDEMTFQKNPTQAVDAAIIRAAILRKNNIPD